MGRRDKPGETGSKEKARTVNAGHNRKAVRTVPRIAQLPNMTPIVVTGEIALAAIEAEHRFNIVRSGIEAVSLICEGMDPEAVEQLCDLVELKGVAELRRYVQNWRRLTATVVKMSDVRR